MNYKNNAMFIAARNGRQASPMVSVLRPRVSLDVDLLNTLDAEEIRLWMLCQAMQQGRSLSPRTSGKLPASSIRHKAPSAVA